LEIREWGRKIARNPEIRVNFHKWAGQRAGDSRAVLLSDPTIAEAAMEPHLAPLATPALPSATRFAGTESHGPMDPPKILLTAKG